MRETLLEVRTSDTLGTVLAGIPYRDDILFQLQDWQCAQLLNVIPQIDAEEDAPSKQDTPETAGGRVGLYRRGECRANTRPVWVWIRGL